MKIEKATTGDIPSIMQATEDAKQLLKNSGSPQWQGKYPDEQTFLTDLQRGNLYVAKEGEVLGFVALVVGEEESYNQIHEGEWLTKGTPYTTIHRMAVKKSHYGEGVAKALIAFACSFAKENGCVSVRADTHRKNLPMQSLLKKCDFCYTGIVYLIHDDLDKERFAYEKIL